MEHLGQLQGRLTFELEQGEICNLDLEDYH
jgi:hypothetical protein